MAMPRLVIPYFEFLKLSTWLKIVRKGKAVGFADVTLVNGEALVNNFALAAIDDESNSLFDNLSWEMATANGKALLWFYYDPAFILSQGTGGIINTFHLNKPATLFYSISLIIGHNGKFVSSIVIHEPIRTRYIIPTYLLLPTVDESAIKHWLTDVENISGDDKALDSLAHLQPQYYGHQSVELTPFFESPEKVLKLNDIKHKITKSEDA
jgi:hypothetical protein